MTIEQLIKEAAIEAIKTASKSAYLEGIKDGRKAVELLVQSQNDWVLFKELPDHTGRSLSYLKNRKNEANAPKPSLAGLHSISQWQAFLGQSTLKVAS